MKNRIIVNIFWFFAILSCIFSLLSCERVQETLNNYLNPKREIQNFGTIIEIKREDMPHLTNDESVLRYRIEFSPLIEFFGEAFPVKILSTAALNTSLYDNEIPRMKLELDEDNYLGDLIGDFGVTIMLAGNEEDAVPVRIEIESSRFIRKSGIEAVIPPNRKIEIFPRIDYDYNALERLTQSAVDNVYFRLFIGANKVMEMHEVVRFNSVNEVPFKVLSRWDNETMLDYSEFFTAYVNEDDPIIDIILREALQTGITNRIGGGNFGFTGYQRLDNTGNSTSSVRDQVLAIWSVFLNHGIKYSSITTTSRFDDKVITQYVRTLGESFENRQANCVDGTVLFASILRKIGIEPFLVLEPGHMFLAFITDWDTLTFGFLETTMLGNYDLANVTRSNTIWGGIKDFFGGRTDTSVTIDSFNAAYFTADLETIIEVFEENEDYMLISVSDMREMGIMPIRRY